MYYYFLRVIYDLILDITGLYNSLFIIFTIHRKVSSFTFSALVLTYILYLYRTQYNYPDPNLLLNINYLGMNPNISKHTQEKKKKEMILKKSTRKFTFYLFRVYFRGLNVNEYK